MIVLGNSVSLCGVAGTATAVTITVSGSSTISSTETPKQLYQGQLPNAAGTLFTAGASEVIVIKTILLANTTGSDVTGVKLMVGGTANSNIVSPTITIPANGGAVYDGVNWNIADGTGKLLESIDASPNSIANAALAQAAAYTVKGNNTGSTANETDISIGSAAMSALPNLSGTNTGDETAASIESKLGVSAANITALANLSGTNTGDQTLPTDATIATSDVTTNNASTSKHGWAPKAVAPAAGQLNVLGIANGETVVSNKTILDTTTPSTQAFGDAASAGTSLAASHADHKHAMPAAPTATSVGLGNVTNNAQTQAAIVPNTAPSAGQILVGNAGGTAYAPVSATGDVTIASTGAHTVGVSGVDQGRGVQSIATAAGTTVLTVSSPAQNVFTGTNTQTVQLPDATTLAATNTRGWSREIDNNSTGAVTIKLNDTSTTVATLAAGTMATVRCLTTGTTNGTWEVDYFGTTTAAGKVATFNDNISFPANATGIPVSRLGDGNITWMRGMPALFGQLHIFGHSYLDMTYGLGNFSPWANQNQDSIDGNQFAQLVGGLLGANVINHCKVGANLVANTVGSGNYSKVFSEINRSNQHWPFTQSDGTMLLVFGINDISAYSVANQALLRSSSINVYNALIAKWRSSAYFPVQTGSPLQWTTGANFSNAAAANRDWNGGGSVVATVVDSAGSSTATFKIPFGYNGQDITFYLIGNNSANSCIVTWGGTVTGTTGIVGATTTINGTTIDAHGMIPIRFTAATNGLTAANAGQTITVRVTTSSSGTFELCGASIGSTKPNPVVITTCPRLVCAKVNFAFGDGVGNGTTTFTSATALFENGTTRTDVGGALIETDAQGKIPANTTVSSVTNGTTVVANNTIASGTNIQFTIARTINGYNGSSGNANFNAATPANHTAADGDVANYNTMLGTVKSGWDGMVGVLDLDAALAVNPAYYAYDGLHLNDLGQTVFIREFVNTLSTLTYTGDGFPVGIAEALASGVPIPPKIRFTRRSGQVYFSPGVTIAGTGVTLATGDMYAIPFPTIESAEQWATVYIEVTTASATTQGTVRVGCYDDDMYSGYPQFLRNEFTSSGAFGYGTTTGAKTVSTPTNFTPKPGMMWLVIKIDSAGTAAGVLRANTGQSPYLPNWSASGGTGGFVAWKLTGQSAGALPNFFPTGAALATTAPVVGIQVNIL